MLAEFAATENMICVDIYVTKARDSFAARAVADDARNNHCRLPGELFGAILRGSYRINLKHGDHDIEHDEASVLPSKRLAFLLVAVLLPLYDVADRSP